MGLYPAMWYIHGAEPSINGKASLSEVTWSTNILFAIPVQMRYHHSTKVSQICFVPSCGRSLPAEKQADSSKIFKTARFSIYISCNKIFLLKIVFSAPNETQNLLEPILILWKRPHRLEISFRLVNDSVFASFRFARRIRLNSVSADGWRKLRWILLSCERLWSTFSGAFILSLTWFSFLIIGIYQSSLA